MCEAAPGSTDRRGPLRVRRPKASEAEASETIQDIVRALKRSSGGTDDSVMSDTSWLKTSPWVERRTGERFTVREPTLNWRAGPSDSRPPADPAQTSGEQCRFLDVSATGALLLAPAADDLSVDSEIVLSHDGELSRVRISRIEPYNSAFSFYGVSFIEMGGRLREFIDSVTDRRRVDSSA